MFSIQGGGGGGEGEGGHIQIWLAVKDIRSAVRSGGGMVEEGGD